MKTLFLLLSGVWIMSGIPVWGAADYQALAADIGQRLDKCEALYAEGKPDEARREVQMAYFEVFENLEGPIRINISARKSAEMEASFGVIRRLIGEGKPQPEVAKTIASLKAEVAAVVPVLADGHRLTAEATHDSGSSASVDAAWQQSFQVIDDRLAEAVACYQDGRSEEARQKVQAAWYEGFKNSEMEIAVRSQRSAQKAAAINARFSTLLTLAGTTDRLTDFGYEVTTLVQTVADELPGLAAARPQEAAEPAPTPKTANWAEVTNSINRAIDAAIAAYVGGDKAKALMAVQNAYFDLFEASGMEASVGSRDAALKTKLEGYFTRLVSQMKAGQAEGRMREQAALLAQDLAAASAQLGASAQGFWQTFVYSFLIILREGVEALLIVAAIVAYLIRNDHRDKLGLIANAVVCALVASAATALVFQWFFTNSGASRELLEGVTMLGAAIVLFFMSYWLLSKAEAAHWKAYLEGRLSQSLSRGSLFGLWLAAFLAVYREGAETILFYFAMFLDAGSTPQGVSAIVLGFVSGGTGLVVIYFIMRFAVVRLPLKPFFIFTGFFLYYMAFVFAGKGVLELIEGKLFHPTLLPGFPEIPWLGVFPYIETLVPQAVLLAAAIFAWWVLRRQKVSFPPTVKQVQP